MEANPDLCSLEQELSLKAGELDAQRPVRELTVSLTFPEGLVPELESFKLTSATNGFQLAAQPEQVERTSVVRLTNGEMPAQSTTMFTFEVEIPEGMNTGRDTS
jgi:hypothetical protein